MLITLGRLAVLDLNGKLAGWDNQALQIVCLATHLRGTTDCEGI